MISASSYIRCLVFSLLFFAQVIYGNTATEKLQKAINGVQELTAQGLDFRKPESQALLKEQVEAFFSPEHIARRALARGWTQLSTEQQTLFVDEFSELLILTYATQLNEGGDAEIRYVKELPLGETRREIHTEAVSEAGSVDILYRMTLVDSEWQVYDVIVEGVSLVSNYRSQFTSLLQRKGPEGLIKTLSDLVEKRKSN